MKLQEIKEIRALLPKERTLFPYFKDKYSLQLLRYAVARPTPVAALRKHPAAQLLQKPVVKNVLATCGGMLNREKLDWTYASGQTEQYVLTLGTWGRKDRERAMQTSRHGINLVLQLNFSNAHNQEFLQLVKPAIGIDPFNYRGHPALRDMRRNRRYTLAWARLDIDWDSGEALIEELQTDWLRKAKSARDAAVGLPEESFEKRFRGRFGASREKIIIYYEKLIRRHAIWDETLLSAVLFFLREELGLREIWMHTPQSGVVLKKINSCAPPVSLYSKLPLRFCFQPTDRLPNFLMHDRETMRRLRRNPEVRLNKFML